MNGKSKINKLLDALVTCGMDIVDLEWKISDYVGDEEEEIKLKKQIEGKRKKINNLKNKIFKNILFRD